MKSALAMRSAHILPDLVSLSPPTSVVIVHSESVEFVRIPGKRFETLLRVSDPSLDPEELFGAFCCQLKACEAYYGQPFAVLLDNHMAFTFIKKYASLQPIQIRDQLQVLRHENTTLNFTTKAVKGGTLLVAQGMDNAYLASLAKVLDDNEYPVTFICALSAYLALNTDFAQSSLPSLNLFWWSSMEYSYFGMTPSGSVFTGSGHSGEHEQASDIIGQLHSAFLGGSETVFTHHYSAVESKSKQTSSPGALFKRGHNIPGSRRAVCKATALSRPARIMSVAFNSLKLLLIVLLALTLITALLAGFSRLSAGADKLSVGRYQEMYARRFSLQRELDSLTQVEAARPPRPRRATGAAALISLFCQAQYPGLALNSIGIRSPGKDSTVVEAVGTARSDAAIFRYSQDVNALGAPAPVTIASFRPEIVSAGGIPDTVLNFKLVMVLNETRPRQ